MKKIILALGVFTTIGFTSCKDSASDKINSTNVEMAANRDATAGDLPVMEFEETEFDFGTIDYGTAVEHVFTFKNTGKAPLVIVSANSSCGCTVPEFNKEAVAVGETGSLLVKYNGSGNNEITKIVTVTANTANGSEQIRIKANVTPKATQEPTSTKS